MNISRRNFLGGLAASSAFAAAPGCCSLCKGVRPGKVALQLYSLKDWIPAQDPKKPLALAKALKKIGEIGFEGVEFAGYYDAKPAELRAMLADAGLVAVGTHVGNDRYGFKVKENKFDADVLKRTLDFEVAYGNTLVICPGGGNIPPGCSWSTGRGGEIGKPSQEIDDFTKKLCDLYNRAAAEAAKMGCKIGLHNHTWEHGVKMMNGQSFWDFFFSNTDKSVCMEQDVGWTTCAGDMFPGLTPLDQYKKYPHRSPTLHAKENGMGKDVKEFDAILGQPGKPGATPVDWDGLFPVTDADGVEWYVVECERHFDDIEKAVVPSFKFLQSKGRV
ncbi:MAG: sugar phosphate isomerase/epimerase [Kiritimatiellae bacterium]|nr:sugar phosphate isomerase/epimerase [Kiritimatiellia bacterium]